MAMLKKCNQILKGIYTILLKIKQNQINYKFTHRSLLYSLYIWVNYICECTFVYYYCYDL